ncbi:hypothetical protein BLOT_001490 [Blomia tropicalis]|nr:hypothetical protein BLOT_001490 [Blomia tropicalis]
MTILSGILRIATGHIIHIHPDTEQEVQREESVTFYDNFHWLQTNCCYRFLFFFMVDQHIDQDSYMKVWFVDATENRVRMRPMQ